MNQITIDNILLVEVPEKLQGFYILPTANNDNNGLLHRDFTGVIAIIPPGSWQFIGTTDEVSEEIAAKIVIGRKNAYRDYEREFNGIPLCMLTALESYQSWLRANKVPSDKRFAILKLNA